jgi:hypothetical protein
VKRQAQQALSSKPKLQLHIVLDAPKVAVPIPEAPNGSEGALHDMSVCAAACLQTMVGSMAAVGLPSLPPRMYS